MNPTQALLQKILYNIYISILGENTFFSLFELHIYDTCNLEYLINQPASIGTKGANWMGAHMASAVLYAISKWMEWTQVVYNKITTSHY